MQIEIGGYGRFASIMFEHRRLKLGRNITPRILQDRDQIIGWMSGKRVLKIDQSLFAIRQQHDVLGMIIAQHRHLLPFAIAQGRQRVPPHRFIFCNVSCDPHGR